MAGASWDSLYLGWFVKTDPGGKRCLRLREAESVHQSLSEGLTQQTPLIAWGFDPVYFDGERIDRQLLVIIHASLHVMTVNSAVIKTLGLNDMKTSSSSWC